jgi:hypothetical protein
MVRLCLRRVSNDCNAWRRNRRDAPDGQAVERAGGPVAAAHELAEQLHREQPGDLVRAAFEKMATTLDDGSQAITKYANNIQAATA